MNGVPRTLLPACARAPLWAIVPGDPRSRVWGGRNRFSLRCYTWPLAVDPFYVDRKLGMKARNKV